ncbi:MAG: hypothetical protein JO179_04360 [Solirubrobacterales bacterium]|nr:hypothetical protein [Solirubrobacterales bacterium]
MREVCLRRASPPGGTVTFAALLALAAIALGACGRAEKAPQHKAQAKPVAEPICRPAARAAVARAAGVGEEAVAQASTEGNNAQPECHFRVARRHLLVVANVDSAPQAYARLERTIVEAGQQFGAVPTFAPPVHVDRVGLDASWFPDQHQLMSTDAARLITVEVDWRGARQRRSIGLAAEVARIYLGKLQPQSARPPIP